MRLKKKKILPFLLSFLFLFLFSGKIVFAEIIDPIKTDRFMELVFSILCFFWTFTIPVAVILILVGAFFIMTSIGDPEKFKKGKIIIFLSLLGVLIVGITIGLSGICTVPPDEDISITLTAVPTTIQQGMTTTLKWTSENTTACTAFSPGFYTGGRTDGSISVNPRNSTTYTLKCIGPEGQKFITAVVQVIVPIPTNVLVADSDTITLGESTTLKWNFPNATSCTAIAGPGFVTGGRADGVDQVTPSATTIYEIECIESAGTVTASVTVTVDIPLATLTPSSGDLVIFVLDQGPGEDKGHMVDYFHPPDFALIGACRAEAQRSKYDHIIFDKFDVGSTLGWGERVAGLYSRAGGSDWYIANIWNQINLDPNAKVWGFWPDGTTNFDSHLIAFNRDLFLRRIWQNSMKDAIDGMSPHINYFWTGAALGDKPRSTDWEETCHQWTTSQSDLYGFSVQLYKGRHGIVGRHQSCDSFLKILCIGKIF